jgi:hypothetical protein
MSYQRPEVAGVQEVLGGLLASRPVNRLEAAALRDYPGTLLNQEQQQARASAFAEAKKDAAVDQQRT